MPRNQGQVPICRATDSHHPIATNRTPGPRIPSLCQEIVSNFYVNIAKLSASRGVLDLTASRSGVLSDGRKTGSLWQCGSGGAVVYIPNVFFISNDPVMPPARIGMPAAGLRRPRRVRTQRPLPPPPPIPMTLSTASARWRAPCRPEQPAVRLAHPRAGAHTLFQRGKRQ
jgi:hypothetical protein